ncbi:uncharacterized protein BO95DRAFT_419219 [Aspergillus brunneoviolaceus CBS 621.78]|uniref:Uncharacterized protein n=1 Tax=Aspergillus brunneoviolaceus CBS 621.78 TaxID=1450534 RepID=A0ACD1G1S1_9EURO|nr:hypothetical protein BO95DRAFT_419219 [Aspergillus brunneoviolaceus CBS 621.78]RAH43180.1 hypothetical protein BO95DRAFT_419219 [Aspergillus brunneoviolaceus CBS 621.78]
MMYWGGCVLACLRFFCIVHAVSTGYSSVGPNHHGPDPDTAIAVKQALRAVGGTTYRLNETALTKSLVDATLFSIEASESSTSKQGSLDVEVGLAVICTSCYINGSVSGFLTVEDNLNVTHLVESITDELANVTDVAINQLKTFARDAAEDFVEGVTHFELVDMPAWPTLDLDLTLNTTQDFPGVHAELQFDNLELYLELDVQLSAGGTYTLNLFTSESIVGISIPGLNAGALFKVSLVLVAEAEVDISSGIHIKLDDGLVLALDLFNKGMSDITLPGGKVEFLPIAIQGYGSLQALLQLEASVGFDIAPAESLSVLEAVNFSAGIGAEVFAYVADFQLEVNGTTSEDADCAFQAVAEYTLAVGAAAGATVAVDTYQWGPSPNTTVPVFYTTLASLCAGSKTTTTASSTITPSATLAQRDASLETTTLSTVTRYTLVQCASSGLVNCPVALQNTTSIETELTTVLTVASGAAAIFPTNTFTSLPSASPFGSGARTLLATSGSPVSYIPPPTQTTSASSSATGGNSTATHEHHGKNNKLIIGLSVGLGVPAIAVLSVALWWFLRNRVRYTIVPQPGTTQDSPGLSKGPREPETTEVVE